MAASATTERALVTGGSGFIGSALVRSLLADGLRVRVFDDLSRGVPENLADLSGSIEFFRGDVRDPSAVGRALEDVAQVYHLACINGTRNFYLDPGAVLDVAVRGHIAVADAVRAATDVHLFVYASSSEIYHEPAAVPTAEDEPGRIPDLYNPRYSYACAKLLGEMWTLHAMARPGLRRVVFRPHNVYGPRMGFEHVIPQLIEKMHRASEGFANPVARIELQGSGRETRAFCFVDDAVRGIRVAAERGEDAGIYHVGTPDEVAIADLARALAETLGLGLKLEPGPGAAGGTSRRCPDISRLAALGYAPSVSLRAGLAATAAWYREHFSAKDRTT